VIAFTVYGQPAPAGSKTIARGREGQQWIRDSSKKSYPWKQQVAQAAGGAMSEQSLLDGPLVLELHFHVPRPKGHYGARGLLKSAPAFPTVKPDVLKLARAVEDALQGVCFRNDSQIVTETLIKSYGEPARCEVRISPMYQQTLSQEEEHAA
jgi:Holliday junction resolvase RusA-like endonuclease